MIWLAGLAALLLVTLVWPAAPLGVLAPVRSERQIPRLVVLVPLGLVVLMVVAAWSLRAAWLVSLIAVPGAACTWLWTRRRAAKRAMARRREVVAAAQALAGQLRIGQIPSLALTRTAQDSPVLAEAAAAQAVGGDVVAAMRGSARQPGYQGLARIAAAWQLCDVTGASIAGSAAQVADALRTEQAREQAIQAELAGPRATGRLLALLPVLGIGLGYVAGGDPVEFLTTSLPGNVCLLVAACLASAGLIWTELLAKEPS